MDRHGQHIHNQQTINTAKRQADLLLTLAAPDMQQRRDAITRLIGWLLTNGWRPPHPPVPDWRDTRRLPPDRVAEHAANARAGITHNVPTKDGD